MLLPVFRIPTRLLLRIFFRKIEVHGRENVPAAGPLLVVANHPNVMLDILIVGSALPRTDLRFIGKSTLFHQPLLGSILRLAGVIPVSRTQDTGERLSANRDMLRMAVQVLEDGHTLVIFPEGVSHPEMKIRALKPGTARIALDAAERRNDVMILPIGLDFSDRGTFRSDVFVHMGPPLHVATVLAEHPQNRRHTERALTERMHNVLAALTRHIDNAGLETVIRQLSMIYAEHLAREFTDSDDLSTRLRAEQEIIRAAHFFAEREPALVQETSAQLQAHLRKLRLLHIDPASITPGKWHRDLAGRVVAVILSPLAFAGWSTNALPYYATRLFVPIYRGEPEMIATVKLSIGTMLFLGYYILLWTIAAMVTTIPAAFLCMMAVIALGLLTMLYYERLLQRWPLWHVTAKPRWRRYLLRRLARERADIVRQLDRLKERYLRETTASH